MHPGSKPRGRGGFTIQEVSIEDKYTKRRLIDGGGTQW